VARPLGEFYSTLGARICEARKAARLTQEQVADQVGLARTSITNIEKGRQPVQVHLLVELAHVLRTPLMRLVPGRK
jgi:transcriptional regulator with XRE-family HTH domain